MEYIYSAMLLHKLGNKVQEDTVRKIIQAAGGSPDDAKVKAVVHALEGVDIDKAIKEASIPVASAPTSAPGGEAKKEKPKEEEKKVDASAGLGALFG